MRRGRLARTRWTSSTMVYTDGITSSVRNVLVSSPPMTVTAMGARHSPPSPSRAASGSMARISAALVIRIGRSRVGPA